MFVLICTACFANHRLPLLHEDAAYAALNRYAHEKLSKTVTDHLSEVRAMNEGDLVLQDTYQLNQIKSTLITELQRELAGKTAVWIPFGNLTGVSLLHGHGFKIPLVFSVDGYADISFRTQLSGAGINRTQYSVIMEITAEVYSLSSQLPVRVTVCSGYPIYEGVLEGDIPQYRAVIG